MSEFIPTVACSCCASLTFQPCSSRTFAAALLDVKRGKRVRRRAWEGNEREPAYIFVNRWGEIMAHHLRPNYDGRLRWTPRFDDFEANDWEVMA